MGRDLHNVSLEPGKGKIPKFIDDTNYADDDTVVARVRDEVLTLLPQVRSQRLKIQELWERYYQVWAAKHKFRLYEGRSDLYFPIARKIVEQHVAGIKMQVFPATDAFWVAPSEAPRLPEEEQMLALQSRSIAATMRHDIEQARVERWLDMFIRQGLIYGTSVVKSFWHAKTTRNYRLRRKKLPDGSGYVNMVDEEDLILYEGPTFKVVNLLDWYIHPITCTDIEEARMIFEDMAVDLNHLKSMEEEGVYYGVDRLLKRQEQGGANDQSKATGEAYKDMKLSSYGVTVGQIKEEKKHAWKLTEIWCQFALKEDGPECACKIVVADDIVLEVRQNPFYRQRPPYRAWKVIDLQDVFYGQGLIESIEHQQYALNAMLNQTLDAVIFQTNHIIVVNTSLLAQAPETLRIAPRAVWKTSANPNEVVAIVRPPDNSQAAFNTANLLASTMQDTAGMPPVMQGKMASKEATAEEIKQVSAGGQTGQSSIIKNLEAQVMSPLMHDWYALEQQFRPTSTMIKVSGLPNVNVDPNALTLDWQFRWMVSSQVPPMVAMQQASEQASRAGGMNMTQGLGGGGAPLPTGSPSQGMGPQLGGVSTL